MFSIVFLITAVFTFEGEVDKYYTYYQDTAYLTYESCEVYLANNQEFINQSLSEHYLERGNNFPPSVNIEDYTGFTLECQPYAWDNQSLTPMMYRPVIEEELPQV
tara:strand:+ start:1627 stop:1941 length:315 start_codon:yes stop_codon:yes gene_type:complete